MFIQEKILLEYIWIDSNDNVRSKIKIISKPTDSIRLTDMPEWNFDGSSTGQAEGKDSDVLIKPCSFYSNPFVNYIEAYLVMCDCWNKNETPHETNHRIRLVDTYSKCIDQEPLFGIEQEYVIFERDYKKHSRTIEKSDGSPEENICPIPYKWVKHDEPGEGPQGPYYCSVGGGVCLGREISDKHLEYCLKAGLSICGTNAEVMASQWEYQIGPVNPLEISDQLWVSRYILNKISEQYNCVISFHPKPYKGDWNGSGGHTNFSTKQMRMLGGIDTIKNACEKLSFTHKTHMQVYGRYNNERLTGSHETSSIDDFSWGISNRGRSIRIPLNVAKEGCGYFEDRRPAANLDPYLVCESLCRTICLDN
jgi:glutamine synthetase